MRNPTFIFIFWLHHIYQVCPGSRVSEIINQQTHIWAELFARVLVWRFADGPQ